MALEGGNMQLRAPISPPTGGKTAKIAKKSHCGESRRCSISEALHSEHCWCFLCSCTAAAGHSLRFQTHEVAPWWAQSLNDWPCQCQISKTRQLSKLSVGLQRERKQGRTGHPRLMRKLNVEGLICSKANSVLPCSWERHPVLCRHGWKSWAISHFSAVEIHSFSF